MSLISFDPSQAPSNQVNILDNAGFETWQRATSFSTPATGAYTADRWRVNTNEATGVTVTKDTSTVDSELASMKVVVTSAGANTSWAVEQLVEDFTYYRSKTLTVSARVWCNAANTCRILVGDNIGSGSSSYHTGNSTFQTLTATYTVVSGATTVLVRVGMLSNDKSVSTSYFDSISLVIGTNPASFIPLNPAIDLARCQRYFVINGTNDIWGSIAGSGNPSVQWRFPVTMRTSPTITFNSPTLGVPTLVSGQAITSPSASPITTNTATISGTVSPTRPAGNPCFIDNANSVLASADM